ncbi:MAG: cofactor-independent phosphoglycerate mutase [Candidatus Goldiibacteriota bacterium HGW-Goldbacteria-1]|nr:MAG: cofactor-independent phosphoglycerate mutase [Candidatus Goldiibacteriota bacterium HGW-Goldbacteria-1]
MKYIILLADGMADRPVKELNGKTPLEAAFKPSMDSVFRRSKCGMVKTLVDGYPLGSDIGNMSVLGNNPVLHYTGRAPMEASSMGLNLEPDDVAFRCNLVSVDNGLMKDYSSGHITTAEADELIKSVEAQLGGGAFKFYTGKSYRHIMVTKGGEDIIGVPPHDITGKKINDNMPKGSLAKELISLMERSREILKNHPVNAARRAAGKNTADMIWLWGQGRRMEIPGLKEKYGISGAVISAVDLVNGIGMAMGLKVINVPGVTGFIDTNFKGKAQYALMALKECDFVYVHVEATDEMGHIGDYKGKVLAIEKFDSEVVKTVMDGINEIGDCRLMITSDHATPISERTHTAEAVPFVIYDTRNDFNNTVPAYSEKQINEKSGCHYEKAWELFEDFIKEKI